MNHDHYNNHKSDKKTHQCPECGLHYENEEQAKKCEVWCKEHKSCNLEIISQAIENKKINI